MASRTIEVTRVVLQGLIDSLTSRQVIVRFGRVKLLYYGLIVGLTMMLASVIISIVLQIFQVPYQVIPYFIIFSIPSIAVVSRIFCSVVNFRKFLQDPAGFFRSTWFTYLGGYLGLFFSCMFVAMYHDVDLLRFSDAVMLFLPLIHLVGRIASINYGCCGIGMRQEKGGLHFIYDGDAKVAGQGLGDQKLIPVHLYEMAANLGLFFLVLTVFLLVPLHGLVSAVYMTGYGLIRFLIEPYRHEPNKIGRYSLYQILLTTVFVLYGIGYFVAGLYFQTPVFMDFNIQYLYNILAYFHVILIMGLVAMLLFGIRLEEISAAKTG